jgi:hypothetical protein
MSALACKLHKTHSPANLTVEVHHILPVAWQLLWQPLQPWPFPGSDTEGRGNLWDNRTVEACPTGHRNTHAWIVRLMHAVKDENISDAVRTIRDRITRAHAEATLGEQYAYAEQALVRFKEVGGSLAELVAAREWGES